MKRPSWAPEPPGELTESFFQSARSLQEIEDRLWIYLSELISDKPSYAEQVKIMLTSISPKLRLYWLARAFDAQRGSGGLESCMDGNNVVWMILDDIIDAYEQLGAHQHAGIIKQLQPLAADRLRQMDEHCAEGKQFDFDDSFWDPWEERWDTASADYCFYDVIFADMKAHPDQYVHKA